MRLKRKKYFFRKRIKTENSKSLSPCKLKYTINWKLELPTSVQIGAYNGSQSMWSV